MGARVDRALSPQFFHRSRGASHPSPPASPCLLLPLFPPQPAPPPLWAQQARNTSGSFGPTLGGTGAHEAGGFGEA